MSDPEDPREVAYALLEGMSKSGVTIGTALQALRSAYATLAQVVPEEELCTHPECQEKRAKRREAAN